MLPKGQIRLANSSAKDNVSHLITSVALKKCDTTVDDPFVSTTVEDVVVNNTVDDPYVLTTTEDVVVDNTVEDPFVSTTTEDVVVNNTLEDVVLNNTLGDPSVVDFCNKEVNMATSGNEENLPLWYENISPTNVYSNVLSLLYENPNLYSDECIVFYLNSETGFGSQLTLLTQMGLFLKKINPNIHTLGHFSNNNANFKYHDTNINNSFFLYFKYLKPIHKNAKCYFIYCGVTILNNDQFPFIVPQSVDGSNVDDIEINKIHSDYFKECFELKIGSHIIDNVTKHKKKTNVPLIGIHLRSIMQMMAHSYGRDINIEEKLTKIKKTLDDKYKKYNIFIATDVSSYINLVKMMFTESEVFYNDFISRINSDNKEIHSLGNYCDSIINLHEHTGFKLGSDILYDCLSLINCDFYFVSVTNIAYIASYINKKNNGIHFN